MTSEIKFHVELDENRVPEKTKLDGKRWWRSARTGKSDHAVDLGQQ